MPARRQILALVGKARPAYHKKSLGRQRPSMSVCIYLGTGQAAGPAGRKHLTAHEAAAISSRFNGRLMTEWGPRNGNLWDPSSCSVSAFFTFKKPVQVAQTSLCWRLPSAKHGNMGMDDAVEKVDLPVLVEQPEWGGGGQHGPAVDLPGSSGQRQEGRWNLPFASGSSRREPTQRGSQGWGGSRARVGDVLGPRG
jgi:hypothetical protein